MAKVGRDRPGGDGDAGRRRERAGRASAKAASSKLGPGVTDSTIKLGLVQVDYSCIKDFVDFTRGDQEKTYKVFVDDLNARGGILGRTVEPVYRDFCPIGNSQALSTCTSFTEDDKVFAVVGVFIDQSGDAQLCIAKNHQTVEIIHNVSQAWIDEAPKGLLLTPNITTDRRLSVILDLLAARQDAAGQEGGGAHSARQRGPGRRHWSPPR